MASSNDDVENIKGRLDIVEHISEYVQLKKSGQNFKGLCPFHGEKTPSFMVSPIKQIFHCFGCSAGGDVIGFTMKQENLTFPEALQVLARKTGVQLRRVDPKQQSLREALKNMQKEALSFYTASLAKNKQAQDYLKNRGFDDKAISAFSVGFAPDGWRNLLGVLRAKGFKDDLITQSGLVVAGEKGAYDIFRNRIIFPIFDHHGEPIAFGGRVMDDTMPKYINSPDTELFNKSDTLYALNQARESISKAGKAIIVEGYLDAIACHEAGFTNVVAPLGTALTPSHLKKLARYSKEIILIFDGDAAGTSAARRSLTLLVEQGLRARVLMLPSGDDPDSLLKSKGADGLNELIAKSLRPVSFVYENPAEGEGVSEAVELILKQNDPILREELVVELADRSRIGEQAIREKIQRYKRGGTHAPQKRQPTFAYNDDILLLSIAINNPQFLEQILAKVTLEDFTNPAAGSIISKLSSFEGDISTLNPLTLASEGEEAALVSRLSVEPGFEAENIEQVIEDCSKNFHRRRKDLEIQAARTSGDLNLLNKLLSERQKLTQGAY